MPGTTQPSGGHGGSERLGFQLSRDEVDDSEVSDLIADADICGEDDGSWWQEDSTFSCDADYVPKYYA